MGWSEQRQNQIFSWIPPRYQPSPNTMGQKYRYLTNRTRYYGIGYSTVGYRILWFLMRTLKCYPPQPPDLLQRMWHRLRGTSHTYPQQRRPGHCASQRSVWWTPLPHPIGLHLRISMRSTMNPSDAYYIREGDPSGERQGKNTRGEMRIHGLWYW